MTKSIEQKDHIAAWLKSNEIGVVITGELFAAVRKPEATQQETNSIYDFLITTIQKTKSKPSKIH